MKKIHLFEMEDWVVLYLDGKKKFEGHSLDAREVLDLLGVDCVCEYVETDTPIDDYAVRTGTLPDTIEEVDKIA